MKYPLPKTLLDNFIAGVDRPIPYWLPFLGPPVLNLGAGNKTVSNTEPLDYPDWKAGEAFPYDNDSVGGIIAYHFFEHLTKDEIIEVLLECQRILRPSAPINIVTPHWDSEAAHQDLDHSSFFSESSWRNLFSNPYYDGTMPRQWELEEHMTLIVGVVQRNLMIVSQLAKK